MYLNIGELCMFQSNQYHKLRQQRLSEATREFNARGKLVARCELCQLADYACICQWRPEVTSRCEFVIVMHRNEVFKPTNTGRLVADVFPQKTHVYAWHRTEPPTELLNVLSDNTRQCFIIFPDDMESTRDSYSAVPESEKITTFILLDGTWKQSGRMFNLSRWLEDIPTLSLPDTLVRSYAVRKAHQDNYLSTVEAAGLCLQMAGEGSQSETLLDYFALFNQHYLATRGCYAPVIGDLHQRLAHQVLHN